jgi:hypothetical protein
VTKGEPQRPPARRFGGWRLALLATLIGVIAAFAGVFALVHVGKDFAGSLDPIPPSVQLSPADGFPDHWVAVTATDGSFTVISPGPGTMSDDGSGLYRLDQHDWQAASCVLYLEWVGPELHPSAYTSGQLLDWTGRMTDPHGALTPVSSGSATGWRTGLSYENGLYPVGAFQVLYARGWEYSMGCDLPMTPDKTDDRLVRRYLDSFQAPASLVTTQP